MNHAKPNNNLPLLPPSINLDAPSILKKALSANKKLAELKGLVNAMPNEGILINGVILQEAKVSSEIESIFTTHDELYRAISNETENVSPHTKEVLSYREALWHGFELLKKRPLSMSFFVEIAEIIKGKGIGIRTVPDVTIKNSKGEVIYTPPQGEAIIREKLKNLEEFLHDDNDIDPLIKMAIAHYQFEAIHPFVDGNGRTGRIVNILYLVEQGLLSKPILFLSHYILKNRAGYYDGLRNVTRENNWHDWIMYMLDAIESTASETQARVERILKTMQKTKQVMQEKATKIYSKDLLEVIFSHPYCKARFLEEAGIAKRQTAAAYLQTLTEIGLLKSFKMGREQYYINEKLMKILSK